MMAWHPICILIATKMSYKLARCSASLKRVRSLLNFFTANNIMKTLKQHTRLIKAT